jgi:hypothetical protein
MENYRECYYCKKKMQINDANCHWIDLISDFVCQDHYEFMKKILLNKDLIRTPFLIKEILDLANIDTIMNYDDHFDKLKKTILNLSKCFDS